MIYEVEQTAEFAKWLDDLADHVAQKAIAKRIVRLSGGLFGDAEPVGGKVSELKFHIGPGYRAYYTIQNRKIIIMLTGGDKSTQKRDIADAQEMVASAT